MIKKIDRERLAETFTTLCQISSPSRDEEQISRHLIDCFTRLGADAIIEDDSAQKTGASCGNLIIRFDGNSDKTGVFFSCHMDTVQPGIGIKVLRDGDIFTSAGETILGSDDKSGIAALIEMITVIQENHQEHGPIEIVITTCEEIKIIKVP